jgi:hypothetical protein
MQQTSHSHSGHNKGHSVFLLHKALRCKLSPIHDVLNVQFAYRKLTFEASERFRVGEQDNELNASRPTI